MFHDPVVENISRQNYTQSTRMSKLWGFHPLKEIFRQKWLLYIHRQTFVEIIIFGLMKWIFPNKIIFSIIFSIKLHFHNFNNDIRISPNPTYKVFSKNTTSHVYSPIIFFQPKNLSISNLKVSRIERKSIISSKDVHNLSARSVKTCEDIVGYDKTHTFDRAPKRWWFAMGVETKTNKRTSILSVPDCRRGSGRRRRRDGTARYNAIKTQPWKLTEISGKGVVKVTVVYFVPRVNYWR